jgi:hypothetical protein
MKRIAILIPAVLTAMLTVLAAPATAQENDENSLVVLEGNAHVLEGETVDTVVVFHGSATIEGTVQEAVVAFDAPVTVSGSVGEDVISFNRTVTIRSGATVGGDVISRQEAIIEEGATVEGDIRRDPSEFFREPLPFIGRIAAWLAVSVSMLVLGLLMLTFLPRAMDAVDAAWWSAVWPSVGWGLLLLIGLPIVAILAFLTLVGIPFGFGLSLALFLIYAVGYATAAWLLGRRLVRAPTSRFVAFLAGLGILRAVALVPILSGIVGFIAAVVGLGAIAVAIWRARQPVTTVPAAP